jgi:hypothetical protein
MPLRLALSALLAIALSFAVPSRATAQINEGSTMGPFPVFEFHSGFWVNLHQTLYEEAKFRAPQSPQSAQNGQNNPPDASSAKSRPTLKTSPGANTPLTPQEQHAWDDALNYYAANYVDKDLLFTTELILIKNQLGDFDGCDELSGRKKKTCDAGLPGNLTRVLEEAATVYRAHQWPADDRANRRWVLRVAPLVREQGVGLSNRLADIYQTKWPKDKIRVDVCVYANRSGAYTTLDPLRVTISSTDPRNQDEAALEVLFHEASHGIAENVQQAIARECRQRDKPIPRDLWHALIFYTTGEVIRPVMTTAAVTSITKGDNSPEAAPQPASYTPYAIREGIYQRGWDSYLQLLTQFWQPYLDGRATYDDSIARMVSAL